MTNATVTTPSGQPLGISHKPSPTEAMFDEFKAANKPAFIGYLPYGFPDSDYSLKAFRTMVEHGVDAVEIGLPYSDPVMDGPVIQAASQIAIDNGEKIANVFKAVETVANAGGVPLVMSYWNLIYHYGVERFARDFENAGGAGLITPDLIPDEAGEGRGRQRSRLRLCGSPYGRHWRTFHHRCFSGRVGGTHAQCRREERLRWHRRFHRRTRRASRLIR